MHHANNSSTSSILLMFSITIGLANFLNHSPMTIYLPRYLPCHLIFNSFHYNLVIWGHMTLSLIIFLTLIKTVGMQIFCRFHIDHTFKIWNRLSRDHYIPYWSSSWYALPIYALVGIFWGFALICLNWFRTLINNLQTLSSLIIFDLKTNQPCFLFLPLPFWST
jgi:hypothetical protein